MSSKAALPWFILSAEYGLVPPDQVTSRYEQTLNTKPVQMFATIHHSFEMF